MDGELSKDVDQKMNLLKQWFHSIDWDKFWNHIISVGIKIAILIVLYFVFRVVGNKIIHNFFRKYRQQQAVSAGRADTLESLITNFYGYVLFFTFAILLLQNFMDVTAIIASAGVASLAIAFGAQGLVSDVVTGFFILLERQLDVGDTITIGLVNGTVEALGLRTTQIRDFDGTLHFIPNRQIMVVSNHSRGNMRVMVDIQISPTEDPEKAMAIINEVCTKVANENKNIVEAPVVLGVQNIDATNMVIRVVGKAVNGEQYSVQRDLLKDIREALTENKIKLPLSFVSTFGPNNN